MHGCNCSFATFSFSSNLHHFLQQLLLSAAPTYTIGPWQAGSIFLACQCSAITARAYRHHTLASAEPPLKKGQDLKTVLAPPIPCEEEFGNAHISRVIGDLAFKKHIQLFCSQSSAGLVREPSKRQKKATQLDGLPLWSRACSNLMPCLKWLLFVCGPRETKGKP